MKLFLKKPDGSQAVVQRVLQAATKDCDNPDVRDKAYVYWRLLSTDPAAAKVSAASHLRAMLSMLLTILNPLFCTGCRVISQATYIVASDYGIGGCVG